MSGYSETPLARKLGIKPGMLVGILNEPAEFRSALAPIPPGVTLIAQPDAGCDVIVVFGANAAHLRTGFEQALRLVRAETALWVAWPKKSSGMDSDLSFREVQSLGLESGLVDNKVCAIDEQWSGLRFVVRRGDRPTWSQSSRKPKGNNSSNE